MRTLRRDKIILIAAAVITVGALASRSYAAVGFYISLAGLVLLLLSGIRKLFSGVMHYRSQPPLTRAWVALQAIQLIIIINCGIVGKILYFPVLLVLAAEYFIYDSQTRR